VNKKEKDVFYFKGMCFDNAHDMFEYAKNWGKKSLTQETAIEIFKNIEKKILIYIGLIGIEFTNSQFSQYVDNLFVYAMEILDTCETK